MKVQITLKVRTVIEADDVFQALDLAQAALMIPKDLFDIDGDATVCKTKPKWWTAAVIPAQTFLDKINKFIDENYTKKS